MAKRPPERYDPGELQRTRTNLGELSEDEARRMMKLLDGEIGAERTETYIENQYKKLQDLNRRKADRIIYSQTGSFFEQAEGYVSRRDEGVRSTPRYRDRMRMNFTAARQDHQIMTVPRAFAALLSFLVPVEEYVNPKFIMAGDEIFFSHIEKLVVSVRGLLAINQRHPLNRLRNSLFVRIFSVLKNWEIEGLHRELTHLQIAPRHVTFKHCKTLTRHLFGPIVQLLDLAQGSSIPKALKHLYDLDILSLPVNHPDIQRIKNYYHKASVEYEYVFNFISRRCYPLLMKLSCSKYSAAHVFYMESRSQILSFLDLTEDDVLQLPEQTQTGGENESAEPEAVQVAGESGVYESPALRKGFEILERLFPQAGWNSLEDFPDLYPYFQPLIGFPRGFELVPAENPLHQTTVLASILLELFRGFRSIEFGRIRTPEGEFIQLGPRIESIAERWRQFLDELIAGHYLPTLYQYCRDIEKNTNFGASAYGSKQRDYLDWLAKLYIFPHLVMGRPKPPDTAYSVPKLYELTTELREVLSAIATELAGPEKKETETVAKPAGQISFEIKSEVSKRFIRVLELYGEDGTSANLLLYTYAILLILDTLLNDPASHFYPYPCDRIYRSENEVSVVPQYTVPLIDPSRFFSEADSAIEPYELPPPQREPDIKDSLTKLQNIEGLKQQIDRRIQSFKSNRSPFVVLAILIREFKTYCGTHGENAGIKQLQKAADIIGGAIREYKDTPARCNDSIFMVLLPDTVREEAVNLAIRLFFGFKEFEELHIPISIGIVQFERTWGIEKCIKTARQAAEKAAELPPPSLCLYDGKKNRFQSLSEVSDSR